MAAIFRKRYLLWLLLPAAGYTAVLYYLIVAQSVINEARVADAIVVFGAAEYDGRPSPVYKARLDHASQLYHRSLAPIVITTGGAGDDPRFNEGGVGREYLKTLGIPDDQLIAETQSTYPAESARRVATIMRANSMHSCIAVSDGDAGVHGVGTHDGGNSPCGFSRVGALSFSDELIVRDAERLEVFTTNATFVEAGIVACAAGGDDDGRQAAMVKLRGVVEPGFVDRRRATIIFSRAEDDDGVRDAGFIDDRLRNDEVIKYGSVARCRQQEPQQVSLAEDCCH